MCSSIPIELLTPLARPLSDNQYVDLPNTMNFRIVGNGEAKYPDQSPYPDPPSGVV